MPSELWDSQPSLGIAGVTQFSHEKSNKYQFPEPF